MKFQKKIIILIIIYLFRIGIHMKIAIRANLSLLPKKVKFVKKIKYKT